MRTASFYLLIPIFLSFFNQSFASEKLQMKLEKGQSILFQCTHQTLQKTEPRFYRQAYEYEKKWFIEFEVVDIDQYQLSLDVKLKRYQSTEYGTMNPTIHFDSMFPQKENEADQQSLTSIIYEILDKMTFRMDVDLDKNELTIPDEQKYKKEITELLKEKKLDQEELEKAKKQIFQSGLLVLPRIVKGYLLKFNNARIQTKDSLEVEKNDFIIKRVNKLLKVSRIVPIQESNKSQEYSTEATIDPANGFILEYTSMTHVPEDKRYDGKLKPRTEISSFVLLKNSETFQDSVTISGYVENPKRKSIYFSMMNAPAGTELEAFMVPLDSTNKFLTKLPMPRENFIFLSESYEQGLGPRPIIKVIYAEPGDSINIEINRIETNCKIVDPNPARNGSVESIAPIRYLKKPSIIFTGDRAAENNFITQNFDQELRIASGIKQLSFPLIISIPRLNPEKQIHRYQNIVLKKELLRSDFPGDVSPKFKSFFIHETEMLKFSLASNLLLFSDLIRNTSMKDFESQIKKDVSQYFEGFQIIKNYEEYGRFSRMAISNYAQYKFFKIYQFSNPIVDLEGFPSRKYNKKDMTHYKLDQQANLLNLILAGSPLVRGKVELIHSLLFESSHLSESGRKILFESEKQMIYEIIKLSQDTLLNDYISELLKKSDELFSGTNYEKRIFLTPAGDTVALSNYIGEKACVINFADSWSQNRYLFDELSRKYPKINVLVVNEGDDFEVWKDYVQRAEPEAIQLFLPNQRHTLNELFLTHSGCINVFDSNGKLMEFRVSVYDLDKYIKKAQNPPKEKQEVNKSTLYGIIWFLGGSLLLGLIAFLIYKARTRLKLRKENQEKRLQELQLSAIRAQMNPHFLFNSLNSVQNLIQKNQGREAHLYLSDFAGLIRKVLKNSQSEEVSLAEEMETLNQYIRLEQLRFDFEYEQTIDDQIDQNHFMVPSMILQPVAENAIMHGLQHKPDNRTLKLDIKKTDGAIQISIEDNGIGLEASKKIKSVSNGIGLNMNEERLRIMQEKYGGNYSFKLIDLTKQGHEGTRVEITIPEEE